MFAGLSRKWKSPEVDLNRNGLTETRCGGEFPGDSPTNFFGRMSRPERLVFSSTDAGVDGVAGVATDGVAFELWVV